VIQLEIGHLPVQNLQAAWDHQNHHLYRPVLEAL